MREARRHAQAVESRHEVVEDRVEARVRDHSPFRANLGPQRHREREERDQRKHADRRSQPAASAVRARRRDGDERGGGVRGDDHHARELGDLQHRQRGSIQPNSSRRTASQQAIATAAESMQRGGRRGLRTRTGRRRDAAQRRHTLPARRSSTRETASPRPSARLATRPPEPQAGIGRQVPVDVRREAAGFRQRSRAEPEPPQLEVRDQERHRRR